MDAGGRLLPGASTKSDSVAEDARIELSRVKILLLANRKRIDLWKALTS
jgi:hypothetical protein